MDVGQIIDAFGGTSKFAEALNVGASAVSNWRKEGIPPARWKQIIEVAAQQKIAGISFETLAAAELAPDATPERRVA